MSKALVQATNDGYLLAGALEEKIKAFVAQHSQEVTLEAACAAWVAARDPYEQT